MGGHVSSPAEGKTEGVGKRINILMINVVGNNGSAEASNIMSGVTLAVQRFAETRTSLP
jgi:hypothetical protein